MEIKTWDFKAQCQNCQEITSGWSGNDHPRAYSEFQEVMVQKMLMAFYWPCKKCNNETKHLVIDFERDSEAFVMRDIGNNKMTFI